MWVKASADMLEMDFVGLDIALAENSRKKRNFLTLRCIWLKIYNTVSRSLLVKNWLTKHITGLNR